MVDSRISNDINRLFDMKESKKRQSISEKRRKKKMTPEEKVSAMKERFGLTHGGSKQNKKQKRRKK